MILSLAPAAFAQQFQYQAGAVPTGPNDPTEWSESLEVFDADGDGDLDVMFANGVGFSGPGGARAPTLLINNGGFSFSSAPNQIPAGFTQQGKGMTVCDIDGDGDEDVIFANAFVTQPRILVNDGSGTFTDGAGRLPNVNLNSFAVAQADVDDDGDIDLVFTDAGPNALGPPGGVPRLMINDGNGFFAEEPGQMNGVLKVAPMAVTAVDIDNDFDLDIIVDGRSVGQHLYLNDGTGTFSFAGASVLPPGSTLIYETDWADLDNDTDIDGFYTSLSGFNEGTARNNLVPSGNLTFTGATNTLSGLNGNDDNEVAYLDYDNDGLLDVIVASLGNNREKLYKNLGTFAVGSFQYQATGFSAVTDSTLDVAVGDLDGDGRYDVVTAQGESGSFLNRMYKNSGPMDTIAPWIGRIEDRPFIGLEDLKLGQSIVRAWIQDATVDSGRTFVEADLNVVVTYDDGSNSGLVVEPMSYSGGGIWRGGMPVSLVAPELVGATVSYSISARDPVGNISVSPVSTLVVCGTAAYGPTTGNNCLTLAMSPPPKIARPFTISAMMGPPDLIGSLWIGFAPTNLPFMGGTVLVDPSTIVAVPVQLDCYGVLVLSTSIPNKTSAGVELFCQAIFLDPGLPGGLKYTQGLQVLVCP